MHQPTNPQLSKLDEIAAFCEAEDMDSLLPKLRDLYCLKHITYYSNFKTDTMVNPYVKTTYQPEWIARYLTKGYVSIDPVVQHGFGRIVPFDWRCLNKSEKSVRQLFGESIEFGVGRQGLSIPVVGDRAKGLLSITSDESSRDWRVRTQELIKDFLVIGGFMHNKAFAETGQVAERNPLSRRETECLQWAALGKTDGEISDILGLSPLTISSYVKSARYKLGCINRVSAVAKAIARDIIHP